MKLRNFALALAFALTPTLSYAWDISDLLNKAGNAISNIKTEDITSSVGDMVDGLLSTSKIDVKDMAGTWIVDGSAVSFQSDNFLQKAGGAATASIVESKLDPYYKKYGLTGAILTINEDGSFTLSMKKLTLSGTITKNDPNKKGLSQSGNFIFNFNAFGITSLGAVNSYVTKSSNSLDIMFDANRLQSILNSIASFSKIQMAQTAINLLNQYDGICIGFSTTPHIPKKGK